MSKKSPSQVGEFEITASNGATYRITGTEAEANHLKDWIEKRVQAGDPDLKGEPVPLGGQRADYIPDLTGSPTAGDITPEAHAALNSREGILNGADATVRGAVRSLTGNLIDEASAGINTVLPIDALTGRNVKTVWGGNSLGDAYEHNVNLERATNEADDIQSPTLTAFGKAGGGALQALTAAKLLRLAAPARMAALDALATRAPIRTAIGVGGLSGAASGALSGFGEGTNIDDRMANARDGAYFGGITGAAFSPLAAKLAPDVAHYGAMLFGRQPEKTAMLQLVQALKKDGYDVTSPTGVAALKQELSNYLGKPVSLADIGSATRARAGVGLRQPGNDAFAQTVMSREAGQGARLASDIRANIAPRTDVHALDEDLAQTLKDEALPLRDKALFEQGGEGYGTGATPRLPIIRQDEAPDAGVLRTLGQDVPEKFSAPTAPTTALATIDRQARIPSDPVLQQIARLPLATKALTASRKQAQAEVELRATLGQDVSHLPDVNASGAQLDMRTLDYMKRYLDKQVNQLAKGMDTDSFKAAEYANVRDLRNALRDRMREVVPEYGDYLDAYSGTSAMRDALKEGRDFRKLDPEQIVAQQGKRSKAAQELYRVGAARDLLDTVNATADGRSAAARILNSNESRAQIPALGVSPNNAAALNRSVELERTLSRLADEAKGIKYSHVEDEGLKTPWNPASGFGWAGALLKAGKDSLTGARNSAVNKALLPRVLETDPAAMDAIITELERTGQKAQADALRRAKLSNRISAVLGNLIGGE